MKKTFSSRAGSEVQYGPRLAGAVLHDYLENSDDALAVAYREHTTDADEKRLTGNDKFKIHLTIYLLDPENPLPQRKGGGDEDYDLSDPAMLELLAGHLRSTKGI